MPKYAVIGPKAGIFDSWDEAKLCTQGIKGARCKKFSTLEEAKGYLSQHNCGVDVPKPSVENKIFSKILLKNNENVFKPTAVKRKYSESKSSSSSQSINNIKSPNLAEKRKDWKSGPEVSKDESVPKIKRTLAKDNFEKSDKNPKKKRKITKISSDNESDESSDDESQKYVDNNLAELIEGSDSSSIDKDESESGKVRDFKDESDLWGDDDVFNQVPEQLLDGKSILKTTQNKCKSWRRLNVESHKRKKKTVDSSHPINSSESSSSTSDCEIDGYSVSHTLNTSSSFKLNASDFMYDSSGNIEVFTDGACSKNGRAGAQAGIGVWFNHNHPLNIAEPVRGCATNNNAEIQAATRAIQQALKADISKLNINTDSKFLINCITLWIHKWKKNGWQLAGGGPVKNKEELVELDNAIQSIPHVSWKYVKGHDGIAGNEEADKLARQGALSYRPIPGIARLEQCNDNLSASEHTETNFPTSLSLVNHIKSVTVPTETASENISQHISTTKTSSDLFSDFIYSKSGYVEVFTDGACINNGRFGAQAGLGVWFNFNHSLNLAEPVIGCATNNNAEIQAATRAIEQAIKAGIKKLNINTDSKFLIRCMEEWLPIWKNNDWHLVSGKPVKNLEGLKKLDETLNFVSNVIWKYVQSHSGVTGNDQADKLAKKGALSYKPMPK